MCDKRNQISNETIFLFPLYQKEIVRKIYSNPNDRHLFDEIFKLCFHGNSRPRRKIDLTVNTDCTDDVIKCSYSKITKQCEISFNNQLKRLLYPMNYFQIYLHQLIHAYLYLTDSSFHNIEIVRDHGYKFQDHVNRIRRRFDSLDWENISALRGYEGFSGGNSFFCYNEFRPSCDIHTAATSVTKSFAHINNYYTVSSFNKSANIPIKTEPTNVQLTNRKIVTSTPKTSSTSQKKSSVPINKKNTANVPIKTEPTNVQSTNRKIVTNNPKTPSTSQKKSLVPSNKKNTVNVPKKTAPTNVQSTNRKIVTSNPKTPSTSQKKSSVPINKKNTTNVPIKTEPTNVQSTNKNIPTKKPLQVTTNIVSTVVTKSSVPTNENNTAGSSRTSGNFPITTTLTNNQGDKIVSIAATKQSTVIVIHHA